MALQYVGGTSGVGTSTGYSVSLNGTLTGGIASSPAAGDIVVVASGFGNTASSAPAITGNNSGAYQTLGAAVHANDTWDTEFRAFYQVMGSTPDTSLTVTRVTNTAYGGGTVVHVWRGQHATTPINVTGTPASGTNGAAANPPSVTPNASGAVVIAMGAGTMPSTVASGYTGITGYSNAVAVKGDGSTSDFTVVMASLAWTSGAADPPAVSGGTQNNTSSSWAAQTIALAPEPPTSTGTLSGSETGADTFAASGTVTDPAITGSLAVAESGADAASGSGQVLVQGAASATETGSDTFSSSGSVLVQGSLSVTESAGDAASLTGAVIVQGALAVSESGTDTFAASGGSTFPPVTGSLSAQESGADTAALTGQVLVSGALSVSEVGADAFLSSGDVLVQGSLSAVESASDTFFATSGTVVTGSMSTVESGGDTFSASGQVASSAPTPPASTRPGFEMGGHKVYIKRGKRIHIFDTVEDADAWVEAEQQATQAIEKAKGKQKIKAKAKVYKALDEQLPHEVIRLDVLQTMIDRFNIPVALPTLEAKQDWMEVARIALLAKQLQDDEDEAEIELLLLH